jgi:hypothetical protein
MRARPFACEYRVATQAPRVICQGRGRRFAKNPMPFHKALILLGLRGTGILARAEQGYDVDQIANDIGMSRQNVEHYMRFKDQMKVAADGQKRLRLVSDKD